MINLPFPLHLTKKIKCRFCNILSPIDIHRLLGHSIEAFVTFMNVSNPLAYLNVVPSHSTNLLGPFISSSHLWSYYSVSSLSKNIQARPSERNELTACHGSSMGSPFRGTCLEHLTREEFKRHSEWKQSSILQNEVNIIAALSFVDS